MPSDFPRHRTMPLVIGVLAAPLMLVGALLVGAIEAGKFLFGK